MFKPAIFNGNYDTDFASGATPAALEAAVNAKLADIVASDQEVLGFGMAGSGDGQTFTVAIYYGIGTAGGAVAGLAVECFEAADPDALKQAFFTRTSATRTAGTSEVYDQLSAGSAKGDRFMGMCVLAPPGSFPYADANASAGFGFPITDAPLVLGANLVFSAAIAAATPANDPVLDQGTNTNLFALGAGADLGKLVYQGSRPMDVAVTVDIASELTAAGPADVTFSFFRGATQIDATVSSESNGTFVNTSFTVLCTLSPGDLLDVHSDTDVTVRRYHLAVERV